MHSGSIVTGRGSSPRLWGTPRGRLVAWVCSRFIPTPVGNTTFHEVRHGWKTVHPHACGEHVEGGKKGALDGGSSPRLWGTRACCSCPWSSSRFIPTPVGNTVVGRVGGGSYAVHPHACGEHHAVSPGRQEGDGSSPRLWGTQSASASSTVSKRFIPTPVGNTRHQSVTVDYAAVHPHACGEHDSPHHHRWFLFGSSPRLWGTL